MTTTGRLPLRHGKWLLVPAMLVVGIGGAMGYRAWGPLFAEPPVLHLSQESVDFGVLPAGQPMTRRLTVTNRGGSPLMITTVTALCGCTSAHLSRGQLLPGETAALDVTLTGQGGKTPRTTAVVLTTNDPVRPELQIPLRHAPRVKPFVEPTSIDFGRIERAELPAIRTLSLFAGDQDLPDDLDELSARIDQPYFRVQSLDPAGSELRRFEIVLTEDAPSGSLMSELRLRGIGRQVVLPVSVQANVRGNSYAIPNSLVISAGDDRDPAIVRPRRRDDKEAVIRSAELIGDIANRLRTWIERDEDGPFVRVELTSEADTTSRRRTLRGDMRIVLDDESEFSAEVVNVPVIVLGG